MSRVAPDRDLPNMDKEATTWSLPTPAELAPVAAAAALIHERSRERDRLGAEPCPCGAKFPHPSHETRHDFGDVIRYHRCPGHPRPAPPVPVGSPGKEGK